MEVGSQTGAQALGSDRIMLVDEVSFCASDRFLQKGNLLSGLDRPIGAGLVLDFQIAQLPIQIVTDPNLVTRSTPAMVLAQAIIVGSIEVERLVLRGGGSFGGQEPIVVSDLTENLTQGVEVENKFGIDSLLERPSLQKFNVGLGES